MHVKQLAQTIAMAALMLTGTLAAATDRDPAAAAKSAIIPPSSDSIITARVKSSYINDPRLKDAFINVSTKKGVVILQGTAPSPDARGTAGDLAESTAGVKRVQNNIQTPSRVRAMVENSQQAAKKTERVVSDSWITTKVKSALLADSITKGLKISVTTENHVVTLSGTVYSQDVIDRALSVALQIQGVASVNADSLMIVSL